MQSKATTVEAYLDELPEDRREAIETVRQVIKTNMDQGYEEGMQYGMISYFVPHRLYPAGYHCDPSQPLPFVCLASQKNYMSLYMSCLYADETGGEWFRKAWQKTGKKIDMGKSCLRFKKVEDLALAHQGKRYSVDLKLAIRQDIAIPDDSRLSVGGGTLSSASLSITPGRSKTVVPPGGMLKAR